MTLASLLKTAVDNGASDLHLINNARPAIRIDGVITFIDNAVLESEALQHIYSEVLSEKEAGLLGKHKSVDFAFKLDKIGSFRANFYIQNGSICASIRILPSTIPTIETLNLPEHLKELCKKDSGLILITGSTGCGKSSTIAAMIESINQNQSKHIITIEDPVEFRFEHKKSIISQIEIPSDSDSFDLALKHSMRQDPDVLVIGEIRDAKTMKTALMAAETGHLVLATLHTNSAVQTLDRVIGFFSAEEVNNIKSQLSTVLQAILSQKLMPKKDGGRVVTTELLINNIAIANLIKDGKMSQIYSQMQLNQSNTQMHTFEQSIAKIRNIIKC